MKTRGFAFGRGCARFAALICLTAAATGVRADDSAFTSTEGVGSLSGGEIYAHICQGCHMPEGRGAVGAGRYPKLAGDPALVSWEYVAITVLRGRNAMPPFGLPPDQVMEIRAAHLSDAQVAEVVNFLRSHFGNAYKNKVTAAQVAALPHPGTEAP